MAHSNPWFPTLHLMNIIGTDVSKAVEIRLGNFLDKRKHEQVQPTDTRAMVSSYQQTQKPAAATVGGKHRPWMTTPGSLPTPVQSSATEQPVLIRQEDIHPAIKHMMEEYIRHFQSVQLRMLCKAAGITEGDLPTEAKYVHNGRNGLCYSYVLGKCNVKYCGCMLDGHVPAGDLSPTFVESLCNILRPGVEARKATEPAAQASNVYPNNKRKQTA
jgi:hypothetical protein